MNVFCFTGNIGKDCEVRYLPDGTGVCNFSVAVTSGFGEKKQTSWVNCALWGKRAESLAPYLLKGQQVAVSGELNHRKYESQSGGGYSLDVRVGEITLVGGKQDARPQQPAQQAPASDPVPVGDFDDDIPF